MKNIIEDESAIMNPIITCIISLAIVVITYFMFMPMLWYITNTLINMGAPAATTLLYMKMAQWGFIIFAAAALIVLLANVWKKTHDTGMKNQFNGYR